MAKVVAVLFGGRTCEHEVSILTAHEAMAVLAEMPGYEVLPVYITKSGRWLTGEVLSDLDKFAHPDDLERECKPITLRPMEPEPLELESGGLFGGGRKALHVDVALPLIHGPNGEDGTLQGVFEMIGLPYAGSGVLASALCMDKIAMKRAFTAADLPQVPYLGISRASWSADRAGQLRRVDALGDGPVFVKPVRGGSSIGVTHVTAREALADAIDLALHFDADAVVEHAVVDALEINCSVLRDSEGLHASVLEAVRSEGGFLTYDQKYLQWSKGSPTKGPAGGAAAAKAPAGSKSAASGMSGHEVPASLPDDLTARIQSLAKAAFDACECDGVARIDFLVKGDEVFVNEINTLPGSLAFYLWEASGVPFDQLLDRMLVSAIERDAVRQSLTYCLDRNLLADIEARKGAKSAP